MRFEGYPNTARPDFFFFFMIIIYKILEYWFQIEQNMQEKSRVKLR